MKSWRRLRLCRRWSGNMQDHNSEPCLVPESLSSAAHTQVQSRSTITHTLTVLKSWRCTDGSVRDWTCLDLPVLGRPTGLQVAQQIQWMEDVWGLYGVSEINFRPKASGHFVLCVSTAGGRMLQGSHEVTFRLIGCLYSYLIGPPEASAAVYCVSTGFFSEVNRTLGSTVETVTLCVLFSVFGTFESEVAWIFYIVFIEKKNPFVSNGGEYWYVFFLIYFLTTQTSTLLLKNHCQHSTFVPVITRNFCFLFFTSFSRK